MRMLWDCRSLAEHMGGIGHATLGWLGAFLKAKPEHWKLVVLVSSRCPADWLERQIPNLHKSNVLSAEAGMIDRSFDQIHLPALLERQEIRLYFNTCFSIPALKTSKFQVSVVHDIVFFEHPEWVDGELARVLGHGSEMALRRADAVLTVSEYSRSRILAWTKSKGWEPPSRLEVVRPALDPSLLAAAGRREAKKEQGNFLLFLGSLEEKKGARVLLDAFRMFHFQYNSSHKLILAGGRGGQGFDARGEIERRGLGGAVEMLGPVSEERKHDLLRNARAFLFPSLYEGFGMPPLEAMAFGTPVIAAHATSLPEVLGDAALWVEPGNPQALADAIRRIVDDRQLAQELGEKGRVRAREFSYEKEAQTLVRVFKDLERAA